MLCSVVARSISLLTHQREVLERDDRLLAASRIVASCRSSAVIFAFASVCCLFASLLR